MSNTLSQPIADRENLVSDVIDSLKRLERVGSETSKTTQKLIDAAADLSSLIAGWFRHFEDGFTIVRAKEEWDDGVPGNATPWRHSYVFDRNQVCFGGLFLGKNAYVAYDRKNALAFSEDIAAGLLDGIVETRERAGKDDEAALSVLTQELESQRKKQ